MSTMLIFASAIVRQDWQAGDEGRATPVSCRWTVNWLAADGAAIAHAAKRKSKGRMRVGVAQVETLGRKNPQLTRGWPRGTRGRGPGSKNRRGPRGPGPKRVGKRRQGKGGKKEKSFR